MGLELHNTRRDSLPNVFSDPVRKILDPLEGIKKSGDGWSAKCPSHEDAHPSLSIKAGDDGRALLCCHAGCNAEAIVAAMGMKMADLFPPSDYSHQTDGNAKPTIVKTYDYSNAENELAYQCVRMSPKDFWQRRPDGRRQMEGAIQRDTQGPADQRHRRQR